jgi:acyl-CoA reductase-like NAD-dependent aldehyde dehydrogenase
MSDVTRRISRWKAKFSPDLAAQTTARIFDDMTARYEASMLALSTMETDTKQVLSASGIDTMYIVFYLDFARQLFRLSHGRTISGPTLAKEAQVLLEKWQNRGLKPEVLAAIRTDVFNVPAPAPQPQDGVHQTE